MHIIARSKLISFWKKHPDVEVPLKLWYKKVQASRWKSVTELKRDFPSADYIGDNRVIFDIKGNRYRIIVVIFFVNKKMFIRFIGTHAEYDKVDAKKV